MSDTNTLERPVTQSASASEFTPEQLHERMIHRRAVEAIVWGMPAVNFDLMYRAMVREVNGGWNQIVYWSRLLPERTGSRLCRNSRNS